MEPQMIDYYNEMPFGINVIDKMNKELEDIQKKYNELNKKTNKFRVPYKISKNIEEYNKYNKKICIDFKNKIKEILMDEENGVEAICSLSVNDEYFFYEKMIAFKFINGLDSFSWRNTTSNCIDKIINELNILTNNKNKDWCKTRVNIAIESLLDKQKYKEIDDYNDYFNYIHFIDQLINFIFNDDEDKTDNIEYLPEIYLDTCNKITFNNNEMLELLFGYGRLSDCLNYIKCERCGRLGNNICDNKLECLYCTK